MGKRNTSKELQLQLWNCARSPNELELIKQLDVMSELEKRLAAKDDLLDRWHVKVGVRLFSLV